MNSCLRDGADLDLCKIKLQKLEILIKRQIVFYFLWKRRKICMNHDLRSFQVDEYE